VFCTISRNGINQITFVMETHLVYCAVGNDFFQPIYTISGLQIKVLQDPPENKFPFI
jgi:hypothetical protein